MTASRAYLDWNASAPLRPEARAAVVAALDVTGNPSSIHAEGRAARGIVETARAQLSEAFGAGGADIVFTSGATEAAALALAGRELSGAAFEHNAVAAWTVGDLPRGEDGAVAVDDPSRTTLQLANSETGIVQRLPHGIAVTDATQAFGKLPVAFDWCGADMALVSSHKIGGPLGVGALIVRRGLDIAAGIRGGGQEMGRRSGTENVAGIAGFGAAAAAAARDLADGVWERVARLRDMLEATLESHAPDTMFVGREGARLPNTTCLVTPGWKGETQVMQLDLAGFAVSAGSACSSGKVRSGRVLRAMGYDAVAATSAIRVSPGPTTTEEEILRFAEIWLAHHKRFRARAA